ncbi:GFA family protein [Aspergillus undulatus]|uniref:GFA family protein n=1 Tax=Aspergillus undulatus TaxID=1810928 RepID=UPI003CCD6F60
MSAITGGCHCGATRYRLTGPLYGLSYCYCRTCQLIHGAPFAPFTNVEKEHLEWTQDDELKELKLSSFATRTVCGVCHAPVSMVYHKQPDEVGIVAVTVDEEFVDALPAEVEGHIFVKRKPGWFVIGDGAPQDMGVPESLRGLVPDDLEV